MGQSWKQQGQHRADNYSLGWTRAEGGRFSDTLFKTKYAARFPAPLFRSLPVAQYLSALPLLANRLALTLPGPCISSPAPTHPLSSPEMRTSGPRSSTEPPGKPVLSLNIAEMRKGACLGKGVWGLRVLFPGPLKSPTPNTPNKFQVEVLSSEQQASPSSHSSLLLQSTPRSFQTPVSSHYSCPSWQFSLLAHSCSEDRKDIKTQQGSTSRSSCPTLAWGK